MGGLNDASLCFGLKCWCSSATSSGIAFRKEPLVVLVFFLCHYAVSAVASGIIFLGVLDRGHCVRGGFVIAGWVPVCSTVDLSSTGSPS